MEKINRGSNRKNLTWKRSAVTGAILAAMAVPLVVMPTCANADLASAVESGSYGPVVSIVSPQYADVVNGTSVSINVAVQQRSNPVTGLQMFVDDHIATPGWVPLKSLQSSKFNWDTTLFSNGPHKLTVRVADAAGLIGQAEITVYVNNANQSQQQDVTAPALKWLGIQNGQVLKGVVNLQLEASASFGVKYIFVMLNSVNDPDKKPALRSWMINQPPYAFPFDTSKVNDGAYVLDALAYDALSNQGEAHRLNIGIANNTINPTYFATDSATPSANTSEDTKKTPDAPSENPDTILTASADVEPSTPVANSNNTNTSNGATFGLPAFPVAPTLIPQQSRNGALHSNSSSNNYSNDNGNSLMVEVQSSAHVQRPTPSAQPRVTELPMRLATNDVAEALVPVNNEPPRVTLAQPSLFNSSQTTSANASLSLDSQAPLTTMAPSQLSSLPAVSKEVITPSAKNPAPVRTAKLPAPLIENKNLLGNARQSPPISTIVNTSAPVALLAQSTVAQIAPQRYFQVNDALSIPLNKADAQTSASVKTAQVPLFPQATLSPRIAKIDATPAKSTFVVPAAGMMDVKVSSRMAQAAQGQHRFASLMPNAQIGELSEVTVVPQEKLASLAISNKHPVTTSTPSQISTHMAQATQRQYKSARLMADGQIGTMPYDAPLTSMSKTAHVVSGQPLFTAPESSIAANSRIASANVSGKSWGYQNNVYQETSKSTKPHVAFLPQFNSKPKMNGFASITVSPVSTKMQVTEASSAWPTVYVAIGQEKLADVAHRYGLPVEVLAKNNNLRNAATLVSGQKINMPRNLQVTYNGKAMHTDVSSMLVGTTSVAAFRFLFEQQGGKVRWDSANQTVHAKDGKNEITLTIGSDQAMVNQKAVMMDMAAFLLSGRTMVPVRLFEESLQAQVTWDPSTGRMLMAMANDS